MNVLNPVINLRAIIAFFAILLRQRELTVEMTRREFTERYAGQVLGILWGFAHPIAVILVYIFIFTIVFQARAEASGNPGLANHAVYLLAGLVSWMAMAETLNKGTQVITTNANLVKQVIFPLEILPAKMVIAVFVNELILLSGVLIFAATQQTPTWSYILLPIVLGLQFIQMLGISMVLSTLGVYIRDLKDVVQVFCLLNIYLMPVIYTPEDVPTYLRWLLYVNPFTYQTFCFQDVIYHGAVTRVWAWCVFALLSVLALGVGYRLFAKLRTSIGNVL